MVRGSTGVPGENPYGFVARQAADLMRKMQADLGLNPTARSRMRIEPQVKDDFDEFLARKGG